MSIILSPLVSVMTQAVRGASRMLLRDFGEMLALKDAGMGGSANFIRSARKRGCDTLIQELSLWRKGCGFVFSNDEEYSHEYTWVIRVIDGVYNFMNAVPFFSVTISLLHEGEVVATMIDLPVQRETIWGEKDRGAFFENAQSQYVKLRISERVKDGLPVIDHHGIRGVVLDELNNKAILRSIGSSLFGCAFVAIGRFDLMMYAGLGRDELAICNFMMRECNGIYNHVHGVMVAGNSVIYRALQQ